MNEDIKKLLNDIKECDSLHNNCDYLLEHSDCDLLIEYIEQLETNWSKLKKWICSICLYDNDTITYEQIIDKMQEMESNNEQI